jgi:hypothetical protein
MTDIVIIAEIWHTCRQQGCNVLRFVEISLSLTLLLKKGPLITLWPYSAGLGRAAF